VGGIPGSGADRLVGKIIQVLPVVVLLEALLNGAVMNCCDMQWGGGLTCRVNNTNVPVSVQFGYSAGQQDLFFMK
jgi:hypothetical protein